MDRISEDKEIRDGSEGRGGAGVGGQTLWSTM